MGNILGKPFEKYVTDQINARQSVLGKYSDISTSDLIYYNNKTPWIRLASSINVIKSNKQAKDFILMGGSLSVKKEDNTLKSQGLNYGLTPGKNDIYKGAYGWGGLEERGYVPMPGITKADVVYNNDGALTSTTIHIKCYSKSQLALIDQLYLRPGYSLLLEFGWSVYLGNDKKLKQFKGFSTSPFSMFLNGGGDQYQIYNKINEERKSWDGNYEAVFGIVSNFKWSLNPDGSYDCMVKLIGVGDVIESLKMNIVGTSLAQFKTHLDKVTPNEKKDAPNEKEDAPLLADKDKTKLNSWLFELFNAIGVEYTDDGFPKDVNSSYSNPLAVTPSDHFYPKALTRTFKRKDINYKQSMLKIEGTITDSEDYSNPQTYITLGLLMVYIHTELLIYNDSVPFFSFDINFNNLDEDENYILRFPGQFSSDPNVCIIPLSKPKLRFLDMDALSPKENLLVDLKKDSWVVKDNLGRLFSIYVNVNYIANILGNIPIIKDDGSIYLLEFLRSLIDGITLSLGGINKIKIESRENLIRFYDENPQNFYFDSGNKNYATFNVSGVQKNEGSFVRNTNLTGEISNDFATTITIGAQSNKNQVTENSTAFSLYNEGLTDRVIPKKVSNTKWEVAYQTYQLLKFTPYSNESDYYTPPKVKSGIPTIENVDKGSKKPLSTNESLQRMHLTDIYKKIVEGTITVGEEKDYMFYIEQLTYYFRWGRLTNKVYYDKNNPSIFKEVYNNRHFLKKNIETLSSYNIQYSKLMVGYLSDINNTIKAKQRIKAPFFLPFNMSLEMDGLAGMVLYQKFKMNDNVLPESYKSNKVDLIIKEINHSITPQTWTTTVETLSTPSTIRAGAGSLPDKSNLVPAIRKNLTPQVITIPPAYNEKW